MEKWAVYAPILPKPAPPADMQLLSSVWSSTLSTTEPGGWGGGFCATAGDAALPMALRSRSASPSDQTRPPGGYSLEAGKKIFWGWLEKKVDPPRPLGVPGSVQAETGTKKNRNCKKKILKKLPIMQTKAIWGGGRDCLGQSHFRFQWQKVVANQQLQAKLRQATVQGKQQQSIKPPPSLKSRGGSKIGFGGRSQERAFGGGVPRKGHIDAFLTSHVGSGQSNFCA